MTPRRGAKDRGISRVWIVIFVIVVLAGIGTGIVAWKPWKTETQANRGHELVPTQSHRTHQPTSLPNPTPLPRPQDPTCVSQLRMFGKSDYITMRRRSGSDWISDTETKQDIGANVNCAVMKWMPKINGSTLMGFYHKTTDSGGVVEELRQPCPPSGEYRIVFEDGSVPKNAWRGENPNRWEVSSEARTGAIIGTISFLDGFVGHPLDKSAVSVKVAIAVNDYDGEKWRILMTTDDKNYPSLNDPNDLKYALMSKN